MHIEFLLEEPSAEALLEGLLPRMLPVETTWKLHGFQGKDDLLKNLASRLKGYKHWLPADWRIAVLIDEDRENCHVLKSKLEAAAKVAELPTRSSVKRGARFSVLNRIAIEELEAWFFGDPEALAAAYPGVPPTLGAKAKYRQPDAITGGTWEALERVLQRAGHFVGGLAKIELAREMGLRMQPEKNTSRSFQAFAAGIALLEE